jgi:hypothetical protein
LGNGLFTVNFNNINYQPLGVFSCMNMQVLTPATGTKLYFDVAGLVTQGYQTQNTDKNMLALFYQLQTKG